MRTFHTIWSTDSYPPFIWPLIYFYGYNANLPLETDVRRSGRRNVSSIVINVWIKQIFNKRLSSLTERTALAQGKMKSLRRRNPDKFHYYFLFSLCAVCRIYMQLHAYKLFKFRVSRWQNGAFKNSTLRFQWATVSVCVHLFINVWWNVVAAK